MSLNDSMRIKILSSDTSIGELLLDVQDDCSILGIKQMIAQKLPGIASPKEQRLHYLGQILPDSSCLKDCFRSCLGCQSVVSLYLSCNNDMTTNLEFSKQALSNYYNANQSSLETNCLFGQHHYNEDLVGMRARNEEVLMTQLYLEYVSQYMRLLTMQSRVTEPEHLPRIPLETDDHLGDDEDDDDPETVRIPRTFCEWIIMAFRLLVLVSVAYYYSNLTRLLVLAVLVLAFYMYQAGYFSPGFNERLIRQEVDNIRGEDDDQTDLQRRQHPAGFFGNATSLIALFFSSFVPEPNQAM